MRRNQGFFYSEVHIMKTAILVDGGFYRRRAYTAYGDVTPELRAKELYDYCLRHLTDHKTKSDLYRIFYYDCPATAKRIYHPLLKKQIDFSASPTYQWTVNFFNELKCKRKLALRLGRLAEEQAHFTLKPAVVKKLCNGSINVESLTEADFILEIEQKCVDMKIGLDIASLAHKQQVNQIILISGDSDFVPAAKLARREGIDFILDPLFATIKPDLLEHVDGIRTCDGRFKPNH